MPLSPRHTDTSVLAHQVNPEIAVADPKQRPIMRHRDWLSTMHPNTTNINTSQNRCSAFQCVMNPVK